jgi:hypothetical protein
VNAKNLNKKIRRLVQRIEKDTKKLAKLRLKLSGAGAKKKQPKKTASPKAESKKQAHAKTKKRRRPHISPERRAELSAAMKARWAAKRARSSPKGSETTDGAQPS